MAERKQVNRLKELSEAYCSRTSCSFPLVFSFSPPNCRVVTLTPQAADIFWTWVSSSGTWLSLEMAWSKTVNCLSISTDWSEKSRSWRVHPRRQLLHGLKGAFVESV